MLVSQDCEHPETAALSVKYAHRVNVGLLLAVHVPAFRLEPHKPSQLLYFLPHR